MTDGALPPSRLPAARIADRRTVYDGWLTVEVVSLDTTVHGEPTIVRREIHDHGDGAAVLAYDPVKRTAILVRQIRAAALVAGDTGHLVEAIAGLVEAGEDPAETVRREAVEEAGVAVGDLTHIGSPFASPGALTERVHLYLAEIDHAVPREAGGGVAGEHEEIEVLELSLPRLAAMADAGEIRDMKTLILVEGLRRRRPELFG